MYGWIWHRLPGRAALKAVEAVLLAGAAAALLWYVAFPALLPLLPVG